MRATQPFNIKLPSSMAEGIKAKVAAGEYANASEVIQEGLRLLFAQSRAMEQWLREHVGQAHDALKADPLRAIHAKKVSARIAAEHQHQRATGSA